MLRAVEVPMGLPALQHEDGWTSGGSRERLHFRVPDVGLNARKTYAQRFPVWDLQYTQEDIVTP